MKTIYKVSELFWNGDSNLVGTFESLEEAQKVYNRILEKDGYQPDDETDFSIVLNKYGENGDVETIESQSLYIEGSIDRLRNKEDIPLMYYYSAFWNAKEKQLEHSFSFQGKERESGILEKDLEKWYY